MQNECGRWPLSTTLFGLLIASHQIGSSNLKSDHVCECVSPPHRAIKKKLPYKKLWGFTLSSDFINCSLTTPDRLESICCINQKEFERVCRSPGYGTLPLVTSSVRRIPKDQTSDLMVKRPYRAASGAVHLIGNLAPVMVVKRCNIRGALFSV